MDDLELRNISLLQSTKNYIKITCVNGPLLHLSITCKLCSINGYVFRSHQSSQRTSQETKVHFSGFKRSHPWVVIGRSQSVLFISFFSRSLGCSHNIMIDSSEKRNYCYLAFLTSEFVCYVIVSNVIVVNRQFYFVLNLE